MSGQDEDRIIDVVVTPDADVVAVHLAPDWQRAVDPRQLPAAVVSAANTATMRALARNVERFEATPDDAAAASPGVDDAPLTALDVRRLLDAVSAELDSFTERLSPVVDRRANAASAGGHVRGTAQRGQVLRMEIDADWAGNVRHAELESELLDVLRDLHNASTPRELAAGPASGAISELMELARDPQRLMRRLGMPG